MSWPLSGVFSPLAEGSVQVFLSDGTTKSYRLQILELGRLSVPSGRLLACDPFVTMPEGVIVEIPPGVYMVKVTIADVSKEQDGSHLREAYLSLLISDRAFASFGPTVNPGEAPPPPDQFYGVPVDAGTVAFVDEVSARTLMPEGDVYDDIYDSGRPDSWFNQMDSDTPLPSGYANIRLPLAQHDENIIISHSGWGDGHYPVIATHDRSGQLIGVHIDLGVVGDFRKSAGAGG
jgi:hypothetical protein